MNIINNYNKTIKKLNSIYIGYDLREHESYQVLHHSINKYSKKILNVITLNILNLRRIGLYRRAPSRNSTCWGSNKNMTDCFDKKPFSTDFSFTRFLTPILNQYEGYALYMDSDMFFRDDPNKLFDLVKKKNQKKYAIWVVKHKYVPKDKKKNVWLFSVKL